MEVNILINSPGTFLIISRSVFFVEWEMSLTNVVDNIKTHNSCSKLFFPRKSCRLYDNVEKYCRSRQARGDSAGYLTLQMYTQNMQYL